MRRKLHAGRGTKNIARTRRSRSTPPRDGGWVTSPDETDAGGDCRSYLLVGAVLAVGEASNQVWVCPDPHAPHGATTGNQRKSPDCEPMYGLPERAITFGFLMFGWGPLLVARGVANLAEP